ncbi:hypothetical protein LRP30_18115 [Bradyrhizobium sp. C-145]|uniref:hypothetical protein n=1 Tax=Bradyrhizobium sp. C-145 TaxID=574727 RepID=UPI00201B6AB6|nr:hypothetical protein [Bradyrhizobium sp. C-145]UQR67049.1 hypothetical protein LRP30_18115 [Bradyrhizobium sp. C-145]
MCIKRGLTAEHILKGRNRSQVLIARSIVVNLSKLTCTLLSAVIASVALAQPALAHSGTAQDPWSPAHLDMLPAEIRADVWKWDAACGGSIAAAQHFALYLTVPGAEFVALHFDDFRCRSGVVLCNSAGCLHQVYVATAGRYRRVLAVHAYDVRLSSANNQAFVELMDVKGRSRTLRWNGSRFVAK